MQALSHLKEIILDPSIKPSWSQHSLHFIFPFLYLCLVANYFSLSGDGGFRYSFITGFILLFFIFQKIYGKQKKSKTGVAQVLLIISISVGVIEYYPRVISYTPETLSKGETWPLWSEEVKKSEEENKYNPVIWPHLSNNNGLFTRFSY